jgi:hypothetical protein
MMSRWRSVPGLDADDFRDQPFLHQRRQRCVQLAQLRILLLERALAQQLELQCLQLACMRMLSACRLLRVARLWSASARRWPVN